MFEGGGMVYSYRYGCIDRFCPSRSPRHPGNLFTLPCFLFLFLILFGSLLYCSAFAKDSAAAVRWPTFLRPRIPCQRVYIAIAG